MCGGGCVVREAGDANVALAEYGDKGGIVKGRKACESDGRRRFLLASDNLFLVPCKNLSLNSESLHMFREMCPPPVVSLAERESDLCSIVQVIT